MKPLISAKRQLLCARRIVFRLRAIDRAEALVSQEAGRFPTRSPNLQKPSEPEVQRDKGANNIGDLQHCPE